VKAAQQLVEFLPGCNVRIRSWWRGNLLQRDGTLFALELQFSPKEGSDSPVGADGDNMRLKAAP
jgi:hypothetical protein